MISVSMHKGALIAGLILVGWPVAAVAQTNDQRQEQAIAVHNAGRFDEAIALLEALDRTHGDDPTTLRLLGSYYAASGRNSEGIATLERARALAPKDLDIALALARAHFWSGHFNEADEVVAEIAAADFTNVELPALRQSIGLARHANDARRPSVAISNTISRVKIGGANRRWNETTVTLGAPIGDAMTVSTELNSEDRAGVTDTRFTGRIDRRLKAGAGVYLAAAITPSATFRESWSIRAGGELQLLRNVAVTVEARHAHYGIGNVTVFEPGIRLQTADARASLTLRSINFWDENNSYQNGWSLRGDAFNGNRIQLSMGVASYVDAEAGLTRRVRSLFGSLALPLTPRLGLRIGSDFEERASSYQRIGITLGLARRF
jgi:YaiO family outer membrane protein